MRNKTLKRASNQRGDRKGQPLSGGGMRRRHRASSSESPTLPCATLEEGVRVVRPEEIRVVRPEEIRGEVTHREKPLLGGTNTCDAEKR